MMSTLRMDCLTAGSATSNVPQNHAQKDMPFVGVLSPLADRTRHGRNLLGRVVAPRLLQQPTTYPEARRLSLAPDQLVRFAMIFEADWLLCSGGCAKGASQFRCYNRGYRIWAAPNWARRRARKAFPHPARLSLPLMEPFEPSSLARLRASVAALPGGVGARHDQPAPGCPAPPVPMDARHRHAARQARRRQRKARVSLGTGLPPLIPKPLTQVDRRTWLRRRGNLPFAIRHGATTRMGTRDDMIDRRLIA